MGCLPTIRINLDSSEPAYRQIAGALRTLLVDGTFAVGYQLPPVRQLATDLGVHHNTVAQAYHILADEGWLTLRRRHGAVVIERCSPKPTPEVRSAFLRRLRELGAEAKAAGLAPDVVADTMRAVARHFVERRLARG